MDIKFLIIVIISIIGFIVLMNELSSLRKEMAKKQENEEFVNLVAAEVKRESNIICNKFRIYTNDMIQQFRTMSVLETQPVIKLSDHDQFVESEEHLDCNDNSGERCPQEKIPYLSEINPEKQIIHYHTVDNQVKNTQSSESTSHCSSKKNGEPKQHHLELIKMSLDSKHNDVASEKITFGQKTIGKLSSYTKTDLITLAKQYGVETTSTKDGKTRDLTKRDLYDNIIEKINAEM